MRRVGGYFYKKPRFFFNFSFFGPSELKKNGGLVVFWPVWLFFGSSPLPQFEFRYVKIEIYIKKYIQYIFLYIKKIMIDMLTNYLYTQFFIFNPSLHALSHHCIRRPDEFLIVYYPNFKSYLMRVVTTLVSSFQLKVDNFPKMFVHATVAFQLSGIDASCKKAALF